MTERKWQFLPEGLDAKIKKLEEEVTDLNFKLSESKTKSNTNSYNRNQPTIAVKAFSRVNNYDFDRYPKDLLLKQIYEDLANEIGRAILAHTEFAPEKVMREYEYETEYRSYLEVVVPQKKPLSYGYPYMGLGPSKSPFYGNQITT